MSHLVSRLDHLLDATPVWRSVQDALSGAVGERVIVKPWIDGSLAAVVPARVFVPNGLRVVESAVPGHLGTLSGSERAVAGAERRLAKLIGEKWGARLVDFIPETGDAVFTVFSHA
jgi:hypothetical protein